jgi:hypothetical protein
MSATFHHCMELLRRLRFAVGAVDRVKVLLSVLETELRGLDLGSEEFRNSAFLHRSELLESGEAFPSALDRLPMTIKLRDGATEMSGLFEKYSPASIAFWSPNDGCLDLPFYALEEELQAKFPNDPSVVSRKCWRQLEQQIKALEGLAAAKKDEMDRDVDRLLTATNGLIELCTELKADNAALRAQLEERDNG